jgi:leader peptidase (prepilin peptidase) / N-methyltransferase
MTPAVITMFAAAGVLSGLVLRPVILRHTIRVDHAPRTRCPRCQLPVARDLWAVLNGRCRSCGTRIGPPALTLELPFAAVFAALASRYPQPLTAAALCWLTGLGTAAALIDLAVHRLPNLLTVPAFLGVSTLLATQALLDQDIAPLLRALLGGIGLAAFFLVLALASAGSLGLGDVKLAASIGTALTWNSTGHLITGVMLALLLAAATGLAAIAVRRLRWKQHFALGPFLILGALAVLLVRW